ncbi:nuclear transport factor 2 family protein [Phyllobacterium sp. CCNWLW109]|uniref:nuclear transport factor 2 family protein n=1 Tax=Phyllobacterium sp. CCNWLW109 TaxID=3127479 RepID=UPI00307743B3
MSIDHFPVGLEFDVSYPNFTATLSLLSTTQLKFEIKGGPLAHMEVVDIHVVPLGNSMFAVSWQEKDGATVTNVQDYDRGRIHSHATLANGQFLRMTGSITITRASDRVIDERPQRNKALVREAMTSPFQRHEVAAVERLYAPDYVQHNPSIPQGRDALQALVSNLPKDVYYEPGLTLAEGNFVAIHGRIRGWAESTQIVVDLFRIENGKLVEHWDVLQNEVPDAAGLGRTAMFDPKAEIRTDRA